MCGKDLQLPLSSLRLLVPPVRLMSACMWQVAKQRNVEQYGKLCDFITLVTEMVPELMSPKQKTQLILGLRARFILELLQRSSEALQDHLNSFQLWTTNPMHEEVQDEEVEVSKSTFLELVRKLMNDQTEKEEFFKEVFPVQYGDCFDTMLQILMWEFFFRLEEFLPVPSFSQVAASFDLAPLDPHFEQCVCDPEDLRMLLQHPEWQQKLTKSEFSFMSDTILSTLASKQTSVACEDQIHHEEDVCEDDDVTDDSSNETVSSNSQLQQDVPSALTSSACCEEAGRPGDSGKLHKRHKKHTCLQCGKAFHRLSQLKRHGSVHKPFTCNLCEKRYKTKEGLTIHQRKHIGERPFVCKYCRKMFRTSFNLKNHLYIHAEERPFAW